ncbi:MAG: hypothetical protein ACFE8J_04625, partial [Candidatus Heimdallarchaeota archaeon]
MFKTKLKRSEFGINIVLIILLAINAAIGLWSAYGAACVAWDTSWWGREMIIPLSWDGTGPTPAHAYGRGFLMFEYMIKFGTLFQVMNVITWVTSFLSAFLIYALLTKRFSFKVTYIAALVIIGLGFIAGLLPALIADTNGFQISVLNGVTVQWDYISDNPYIWPPITDNPAIRWFSHPTEWEGLIQSPHWAKTFSNLMVLGVLVVLVLVPASNKGLKKFIAQENTITRNVGKQLMLMSLFFFWFAFVS